MDDIAWALAFVHKNGITHNDIKSVPNSYAMHPVVHRWTSPIQNGGEKMEYVRLAVMVIGSSVPMATIDAYWILQRQLLPHAEQCSWWMGQICVFPKG